MAVLALAHFNMLNNEFLNKDTYVFPEKAPLFILVSTSSICMPKNDNNTKHTRHIDRNIHFMRNGTEWNLQKTVWCEVGMQLEDIGTENFREEEFNNR